MDSFLQNSQNSENTVATSVTGDLPSAPTPTVSSEADAILQRRKKLREQQGVVVKPVSDEGASRIEQRKQLRGQTVSQKSNDKASVNNTRIGQSWWEEALGNYANAVNFENTGLYVDPNDTTPMTGQRMQDMMHPAQKFIQGGGMNNSLIGLATNLAMGEPLFDIDPNYDPSVLEEIASMSYGFMLDAPFFALAGGLGSAGAKKLAEKTIAKSILKRSGSRYVNNMVANGVSREVAERAVQSGLANSSARWAKFAVDASARVGAGASALGGYNMAGSSLNQAIGYRDGDPSAHEPFTLDYWKEVGQEGLIGGALGATMSVFSLGGKGINTYINNQVVSSPLKMMAKAANQVGMLGAEVSTFAVGDPFLRNERVTSESWINAMKMVAAGKVANLPMLLDGHTAPEKRKMLTEYDKELLSKHTPEGQDIFTAMKEDKKVLDNVLADKEIPLITKMRMFWESDGYYPGDMDMIPQNRDVSVVDGVDGRAYMEFRDMRGDLLDRQPFNSRNEAIEAAHVETRNVQDREYRRALSVMDNRGRDTFTQRLSEKNLGMEDIRLLTEKDYAGRTDKEENVVRKIHNVIDEYLKNAPMKDEVGLMYNPEIRKRLLDITKKSGADITEEQVGSQAVLLDQNLNYLRDEYGLDKKELEKKIEFGILEQEKIAEERERKQLAGEPIEELNQSRERLSREERIRMEGVAKGYNVKDVKGLSDSELAKIVAEKTGDRSSRTKIAWLLNQATWDKNTFTWNKGNSRAYMGIVRLKGSGYGEVEGVFTHDEVNNTKESEGGHKAYFEPLEEMENNGDIVRFIVGNDGSILPWTKPLPREIIPLIREQINTRLFQDVNASIEFQERAKAIVKLAQTANLTTGVHELSGHYIMENILDIIRDKDLSENIRTKAESEMQIIIQNYNENRARNESVSLTDIMKDKDTWRKVHEHFADGYLHFLEVGDPRGFSIRMKALFDKFRTWMRGKFDGLKGEHIQLSPDMEDLYRRISGYRDPSKDIFKSRKPVESILTKDKDLLGEAKAPWMKQELPLSPQFAKKGVVRRMEAALKNAEKVRQGESSLLAGKFTDRQVGDARKKSDMAEVDFQNAQADWKKVSRSNKYTEQEKEAFKAIFEKRRNEYQDARKEYENKKANRLTPEMREKHKKALEDYEVAVKEVFESHGVTEEQFKQEKERRDKLGGELRQLEESGEMFSSVGLDPEKYRQMTVLQNELTDLKENKASPVEILKKIEEIKQLKKEMQSSSSSVRKDIKYGVGEGVYPKRISATDISELYASAERRLPADILKIARAESPDKFKKTSENKAREDVVNSVIEYVDLQTAVLKTKENFKKYSKRRTLTNDELKELREIFNTYLSAIQPEIVKLSDSFTRSIIRSAANITSPGHLLKLMTEIERGITDSVFRQEFRMRDAYIKSINNSIRKSRFVEGERGKPKVKSTYRSADSYEFIDKYDFAREILRNEDERIYGKLENQKKAVKQYMEYIKEYDSIVAEGETRKQLLYSGSEVKDNDGNVTGFDSYKMQEIADLNKWKDIDFGTGLTHKEIDILATYDSFLDIHEKTSNQLGNILGVVSSELKNQRIAAKEFRNQEKEIFKDFKDTILIHGKAPGTVVDMLHAKRSKIRNFLGMDHSFKSLMHLLARFRDRNPEAQMEKAKEVMEDLSNKIDKLIEFNEDTAEDYVVDTKEFDALMKDYDMAVKEYEKAKEHMAQRNDPRLVGGTPFKDPISSKIIPMTERAENQEMNKVIDWENRKRIAYKDILGVKTDAQVKRKLMDWSRTEESPVVFINSEGKPTNLKMSKREGLYFWLAMPQALDAFLEPASGTRHVQNRKGMGWTTESFEQLDKWLEPELKNLGEWMRNDLAQSYEEHNNVYRKLYGLNLQRAENYFPLRRRYLASTDAYAYSDVGMMDIYSRDIFNGSQINRRENKAPVEVGDAFDIYNKYIRDQYRFQYFGEPVRTLKTVFYDPEVAALIRQNHGNHIYEQIVTKVKDYAGESKLYHDRILVNLIGKAYKSGLRLLTSVGIKQTIGTLYYGVVMHPGELFTGIISTAFNKGLRDTMKRHPFLQRRYSAAFDLDFETKDFGETILQNERGGKSVSAYQRATISARRFMTYLPTDTVDNITGAFIKYGDRFPIIYGGGAYILAMIKRDGLSWKDIVKKAKVEQDRYGYTQEQALDKVLDPYLMEWESFSEATQNSTRIGNISAARRTDLGMIVNQFTSGAGQITRVFEASAREAYEEYRQGNFKRMSQHAWTMALSGPIAGLMYQLVDNGFKIDPQKGIVGMLLSPFEGKANVGRIVTLLKNFLVKMPQGEGKNGFAPIVDAISGMFVNMTKAAEYKDTNPEKAMKFARKALIDASMLTGIPARGAVKLYESGKNVIEGQDVVRSVMGIQGDWDVGYEVWDLLDMSADARKDWLDRQRQGVKRGIKPALVPKKVNNDYYDVQE